MSNAALTRPAKTNNLNTRRDADRSADDDAARAKTVRAFGAMCEACLHGSALFEYGRDTPCTDCAPLLIDRAAKLLHGTGHHVARTFAPAVLDLSAALAASLTRSAAEEAEAAAPAHVETGDLLAALEASVAKPARFVEEPLRCPYGARGCVMCGGSGKHTIVRAVAAEKPEPAPFVIGPDGLCECGQWVGVNAAHHRKGELEGTTDGCGWVKGQVSR